MGQLLAGLKPGASTLQPFGGARKSKGGPSGAKAQIEKRLA